MIRYERLESDDVPRPVRLITNDAENESIALREMINEYEFEIALPEGCDEDGIFSFVIPGPLVGEFADCVYEIDDGKLDGLTEEWNAQILKELEY